MKVSFSLGTTSCASYLALWYWKQLFEMVGVCGYDGLEIPFQAWSFNGGRGAAPICAEAIRTKYGSIRSFSDALRSCGIKSGISGLHISAQNILTTMLEYNIPAENYYSRVMELAEEAIDVLVEAGSNELIFSPSPMFSTLCSFFKGKDIINTYSHQIAATIAQMAKLAEKANIRLSLRNEFWGLYRGEKISSLMECLPDTVLFSPDTAQLHIAGVDEQNIVAEYARAGKLSSIKLSDTFFVDHQELYKSTMPEYPQTGNNQRVYCTFGNGDIDMVGIFTQLVKADYSGWVVVESKDALNIEKAIMTMQVYYRSNLAPAQAERRQVINNGQN